MDIYLDFDGTVVEHDYPKIGRCNFGCMEVIKKLQDAGHKIILNTYRADCKDGTLEQAISLINDKHWMLIKDKSFRDTFELKPLDLILPNKIHPNVWDWDVIKLTNEIWIDDIAVNIPLKPACMVQNMMVDWDELDKQFIKNKIYEN